MPRYTVDAEKMQSHLEEEIEECGNPTADNNPIAYGVTLGLKMALSYTKTLSTADTATVVHAHWEKTGWQKRGGEVEYRCSHCKRCKIWKKKTQKLPYYCEKCGAKMDEEIEK